VQSKTKKEANAARVAANKAFRAKKIAAGRHFDTSDRLVPRDPTQDKAMKEFWSHIDKDKMREALREAGEDKHLALAGLLLDPSYNGSLSTACKDCGLTLNALNDLWRKHNMSEGLIRVAARLPKVMEDTALDAESKYEVCDRCDGEGSVERTRLVDDVMTTVSESCPRCKGAREIRIAGDAKARDQVFEMVGLTGKAQGPLVAIQQNFTGPEDFEGRSTLVQKLLQQPRRDDGTQD
jgi:hypothetical protein